MADLILTQEERVLVLRHRKEQNTKAAFNAGVICAQNHLRSLAEQSGGGSGAGGETYIVAVDSLSSLLIKA